ncbi:hypothetical protein PLESTB_001765900 [Pleodorina starrii]|uniref:Uncharacterized protein n=1 Tax=Pleodorina starrii TaxID=330485 RepID=A0A9W6C156_9CHLO|nr:hypothetical protein PLESTB_001765900 [Pleodorina starrii]GLC77305.1 hypothetical protein PLESTF_001917800 [Pleodorina starrii]
MGRLGSLPRLPGAEAPSGREKGRSKVGEVASLPAAAASAGGRASGGSDGHGVAVALVVAVDLAVCDAAASVAAQSSDDGLPSVQPLLARCNPAATTAAGGEAALAPPPLPPPPLLPPPLPRNGGPPGGGGGNTLNDTASHYVSLPHTGPASRRMTAPAYGGEGRSGVSNGVPGAMMPPPLKKQHPPLLAAAAARLMGRQSGVSVNPPETSCYLAEGLQHWTTTTTTVLCR